MLLPPRVGSFDMTFSGAYRYACPPGTDLELFDKTVNLPFKVGAAGTFFPKPKEGGKETEMAAAGGGPISEEMNRS